MEAYLIYIKNSISCSVCQVKGILINKFILMILINLGDLEFA